MRTNKEIFSDIYQNGIWGTSPSNEPFFSGGGSHNYLVVNGYIENVRRFILSLPKKPDVVDLGCGDFSVSSKIRDLCGSFTACDVVPDLIDYNKIKYHDFDVNFLVKDFTVDNLPRAEIVIVRQVFQHLSNDQIKIALEKVISNYKFIILTEHLPSGRFIRNLDKPTGAGNRLEINSGVVLTRAPFNIKS